MQPGEVDHLGEVLRQGPQRRDQLVDADRGRDQAGRIVGVVRQVFDLLVQGGRGDSPAAGVRPDLAFGDPQQPGEDLAVASEGAGRSPASEPHVGADLLGRAAVRGAGEDEGEHHCRIAPVQFGERALVAAADGFQKLGVANGLRFRVQREKALLPRFGAMAVAPDPNASSTPSVAVRPRAVHRTRDGTSLPE